MRRNGMLAALLAAVLTLAVAPGLQAVHGSAHHARHAAVLAAGAVDTGHGSLRTDSHGAPATAPATARTAARLAGTSDAGEDVSSRTAHAPQVRGPPAEAAA